MTTRTEKQVVADISRREQQRETFKQELGDAQSIQVQAKANLDSVVLSARGDKDPKALHDLQGHRAQLRDAACETEELQTAIARCQEEIERLGVELKDVQHARRVLKIQKLHREERIPLAAQIDETLDKLVELVRSYAAVGSKMASVAIDDGCVGFANRVTGRRALSHTLRWRLRPLLPQGDMATAHHALRRPLTEQIGLEIGLLGGGVEAGEQASSED